MTKRFCVLYSDGSMNVLSDKGDMALREAREEAARANGTGRSTDAKVGTIDFDQHSFEELR